MEDTKCSGHRRNCAVCGLSSDVEDLFQNPSADGDDGDKLCSVLSTLVDSRQLSSQILINLQYSSHNTCSSCALLLRRLFEQYKILEQIEQDFAETIRNLQQTYDNGTRTRARTTDQLVKVEVEDLELDWSNRILESEVDTDTSRVYQSPAMLTVSASGSGQGRAEAEGENYAGSTSTTQDLDLNHSRQDTKVFAKFTPFLPHCFVKLTRRITIGQADEPESTNVDADTIPPAGITRAERRRTKKYKSRQIIQKNQAELESVDDGNPGTAEDNGSSNLRDTETGDNNEDWTTQGPNHDTEEEDTKDWSQLLPLPECFVKLTRLKSIHSTDGDGQRDLVFTDENTASGLKDVKKQRKKYTFRRITQQSQVIVADLENRQCDDLFTNLDHIENILPSVLVYAEDSDFDFYENDRNFTPPRVTKSQMARKFRKKRTKTAIKTKVPESTSELKVLNKYYESRLVEDGKPRFGHDKVEEIDEDANAGGYNGVQYSRVFPQKTAVLKQLQRVHRAENKSYTCGNCGKRFIHSRGFNIHLQVCEGKTFDCEICGHPFKSLPAMYKHAHSHKSQLELEEEVNALGGAPIPYPIQEILNPKDREPKLAKFKCETCGKLFEFSSAHVRHSSTHSTVQCSLCSAPLKPKLSLKQHIQLSPVGVVDRRKYECKVCLMTFQNQHLLRIHTTRAHTSERPYQCSTCGKGFASIGHLTMHQSVHSGETHECQYCAKTFGWTSSLVRHVRDKHEGLPET